MTIHLPLLPPLPVGDRFVNTSTFRELGTSQQQTLYECWGEAVHAYAVAYATDAIRKDRKAMAGTAAQPVQPEHEDVRDAARYRWLTSGENRSKRDDWIWDCVLTEEQREGRFDLHSAIDAAILEAAPVVSK